MTDSIEQQIRLADNYSAQLERLLFNKSIPINTNRDELCMLYWSLIFDHHRGILLLLQTKRYAPAFALVRPITEAFFRLYVAIHGTEPQLEALKNGTYNTDFASISEQIDRSFWGRSFWGDEPLFGPRFNKERTQILHGFTHGGLEQLARRKSGTNIVPNYPEDEIRSVVSDTTMFAFLAAPMVTEFLDFKAERQKGLQMFDEYLGPEPPLEV